MEVLVIGIVGAIICQGISVINGLFKFQCIIVLHSWLWLLLKSLWDICRQNRRAVGVLQSHRTAWVGRDLKDHPVPAPVVGWLSPTSSGCPVPHPAKPWAPPGMGHPEILWAVVPEPHHPQSKKCPNLNLLSFGLKPFPPYHYLLV